MSMERSGADRIVGRRDSDRDVGLASHRGQMDQARNAAWGQTKLSPNYEDRKLSDEASPTMAWVEPASQYSRYSQLKPSLPTEGRKVNHKRVERLWRREGPKVPARSPNVADSMRVFAEM